MAIRHLELLDGGWGCRLCAFLCVFGCFLPSFVRLVLVGGDDLF